MTDPESIYYRQCFSTEAGRRVLSNILCESGFFKHIKTPEEAAVENFVKTILTKTGGYKMENAGQLVQSILNLQL
jgi:hypothetical protein